MIDSLIRFAKRFAVLLPGLAAAYYVTTDVYPVLDRNIPAPLAVLGAYVIMAYGLIPLGMRLVRFFLKAKHLPLYCVTPDGFASDPVNIGLIGTRKQVVKAMTKAGWFLADKRNLKTLFRMGLSIIFKQSYPNAPFSNLYLFGRHQDVGFELPMDENPTHRHHVRFWLSEPSMSEEEKQHVQFWQRHGSFKPKKKESSQLWVGAASLDTGLAFIRHNAQITHMIHPNTNAERELIVKNLKTAGLVKTTKQIKIGKPYKLRNRVLHGQLHADGKMTIVTLRK